MAKSLNLNDIVNQSITNVMMQNSQTCSQNNTQTQQLLLKDIDTRGTGCSLDFGGIQQESIQAPSFSCLGTTTNSTNIINQLKEQVKQNTQSKVSGLGINNNTVSENVTKITNAIENNFNFQNSVQCLQDNFSKQEFYIDNIKSGCPAFCNNPNGCPNGYTCDWSLCKIPFNRINQVAVQKAVNNCITKNTNIAKAITDAETILKQAAKTRVDGVGIIATIVSCISFVIFGIIALYAAKTYIEARQGGY